MTLRAFLTRLIWLCMLPLFVLAVGLAADHVADIQDVQNSAAERLAKNAAAAMDQFLSARTAALQILAHSPLADDPARWPDLYREAQGLSASLGGQVILSDSERRVRFHTALVLGAEPPALSHPAGESAFANATASGQPAVGDVFEGPLTHQPMVAIAVPGMRNGRPAFVVLNVIDRTPLEQHLQTLSPPDGWSLWVEDSRGTVVARSAAQRDNGAGSSRFPARMSSAPWLVVLELPRAHHLAPMAWAAAAMVLAVLGATLAGVLGGQWAARRLSGAMRTLVDAPAGGGGAADIAEVDALRQRLEQSTIRLQVREAQLRGIFESASEAILTVDAAQNVVMVNAAAARMFGLEVEQMLGSPLDRLIPGRHRATHRERMLAFGESAAGARPMGMRREVTGLRADGTEFPIDAAISHVHVDGQRLYTVIMRDVTESRRVQAALEASHAELRRLVTAQDQVQEAERRRIARELHDDLQQTLAAILMEASASRDALDGGNASRQAAQGMERIGHLAGSAIASTRRIVNDLRPQILEELGLVPALEAMADRFAERTGIAVAVDTADYEEPDDGLDPALATCLYRVAQEALNNVAKHAQARQVRIRLAGPAASRLLLGITDDGLGLRPQDRLKRGSFGLLGMRERVLAFDGTVRVRGEAGVGTTVEAEVTLPGACPDLRARAPGTIS